MDALQPCQTIKSQSFALERQRLGRAYEKYGIAKTAGELDEEAADLIRYQQAYQAAAQVIQASQRLFDTLLQIS